MNIHINIFSSGRVSPLRNQTWEDQAQTYLQGPKQPSFDFFKNIASPLFELTSQIYHLHYFINWLTHPWSPYSHVSELAAQNWRRRSSLWHLAVETSSVFAGKGRRKDFCNRSKMMDLTSLQKRPSSPPKKHVMLAGCSSNRNQKRAVEKKVDVFYVLM